MEIFHLEAELYFSLEAKLLSLISSCFVVLTMIFYTIQTQNILLLPILF